METLPDPLAAVDPVEPQRYPPVAGATNPPLARQILRYAPAFLVPALVEVTWSRVFTHSLPPAVYGQYGLAISVATVVASMQSQWVCQSVQRFLPGASADLSRRTSDLLALFCGAVALAALPILLAGFLIQRSGSGWALVAPTAFLAAAITTFTTLGTVLQARLYAGTYSLYRVASSSLKLGLGVAVLFLLRASAANLLWAVALCYSLPLLSLWRKARIPSPLSAWHNRREVMPTLVAYAKYGVPMAGWFVGATLLELGDRYVIAFFRSTSEVGIYTATYSLIAGATALSAGPVILAGHSMLMKTWADGAHHLAAQWTATIIEWFFLAGSIVVSGAMLFSADLAALILGPAFREGTRIIPAVVCGTTLWQVGLYTHKPLEFARRTDLMFASSMGVAALNLALNCVFVPRMGYIAAAYVTLASSMAYVLLTSWLSRRYLRIRVAGMRIALTVALTLTFAWQATHARAAVEEQAGYDAGVSAGLVALLGVMAITYIGLGRHLMQSVKRLKAPDARDVM